LKFTPEVVPELLKDSNPEAMSLVRDAIAAGMENAKGLIEIDARARGISPSAYSPWIQRLAATYGSMEQLKQQRKEWYVPHQLEPVLRAAVAEKLAQGKIEPWLTMAWINLQFPENNAEQVKLMQALFKTPAWAGLPFHVQYAAREWFNKDAMTPGQIAWLDAANPSLIFKNLSELPKEADAAAATAALTAAMEGIRKSPVFLEIQGSEKLQPSANEFLMFLKKSTSLPNISAPQVISGGTLPSTTAPTQLCSLYPSHCWKPSLPYHTPSPMMD